MIVSVPAARRPKHSYEAKLARTVIEPSAAVNGSVRFERSKQKRKRALLDAARAIIRENESTGFAMRAIAERAGVSEVTPYNLFGSKLGILRELLTEELQAHRAHFEQTEARDALDALFKFVEVTVDTYRQDAGFFLILLRELNGGGDPALRSFFSIPRRQFFVGLVQEAAQAGLITEMLAPRLTARLLAHVFRSAVYDWLFEGISLDSLAANIGLGFAVILHGVASPAAQERCATLIVTYQELTNRYARSAYTHSPGR